MPGSRASKNRGRHRTYPGVSFLADDESAFDKGSARVVDAVEHRLEREVNTVFDKRKMTCIPSIESSWL